MRRTLAPVVAALLLATACATESDDAAVEVRTGPAAVATLRAVPDAAADAGTASFEMVMEMSIAGETFEVVSTGAYDADAQRMAMEVDMGAMFDQLAESAGEAFPAEFSEPMQYVADGSTLYLRAPMYDAIVGPGGWLSVTPDDFGAAATDMALGMGSYDPSKLLESLRGITGEPEVVATEDVGGVETTHYRATMDLAEAIAAAPSDQREYVVAQLEQLGEAEIPVDVWVDGDGLPRRMQMDMAAMYATMGVGDDARAVMTMEFFGYGEPVTIEVPSPDEVTPFADLLGDLGGVVGERP